MSNIYLAPSTIVPKAGTPGVRFGNIFVPIAKPLPPIPTDGLVFHASLSSNAATAETGQALNINGVTFTADSTLGTTVGVFNGSNSYITFSDAGFPIGNAASTVSAWTLINSISDRYCIILGYGANSLNQMRGNAVLVDGALNQTGAFSADNSLSTAPGVCHFGEWVHVAFVNVDGLIKFYVNGNDVGIQSYARETVLSMGSIGSYYGGLEGFLNGRMSSLRVYNRELNADEIAALAKEFK